ncbi:hypothetical protein BHE74_00013609 [Ensete ventricosum]|nr:hypothetical protein BHE74_00013609 [Ensete ventricosum]
MEEDRGAAAEDEMMEEEEEGRAREKSVLMWGYLPGMSPQRSPLLYPVAVRMPDSAAGDRWMDVSGGGCGFAMAISGFDTGCGEKNSKRRRLSSAKVEPENKASSEETLSALPCLVTLDTGVRIVSVAAGGRHTLALSGTSISLIATLCNYISLLHSLVNLLMQHSVDKIKSNTAAFAVSFLIILAILHYAHGEEAPLRNSWLDDSPSASYMRLPGDSGRLRSPEIRLRSSSPSAASAASATTQSLTRRSASPRVA